MGFHDYPPGNTRNTRDVGSKATYGIPIICPENNWASGSMGSIHIVDKLYKNALKP
jgi:hypothetical protein